MLSLLLLISSSVSPDNDGGNGKLSVCVTGLSKTNTCNACLGS